MRNLIITITAVLFAGCASCSTNTTFASGQQKHLSMPIIKQLVIPSDDGQQGVATDGEFIYVQNTQQLFKYRLNGKLVMEGPRLKLHHGGIVFVKNQIYAAVSSCEPEGSGEHFVHVYDSNSLELIRVYDVGEHFTVCAGGIAHSKGNFFVAESFFDNDHSDRILEFDSAFRHIKTHEINFKSPFGIQGLVFLPYRKQFQVHSHMKVFYRISEQFESDSLVLGQSEFDLQDLARLNRETLIINHRHAESLEFVKIR